MVEKKKGRPHRSPIQGGRPRRDVPAQEVPERASNRSWHPGRQGQGGEGFSDGYGGSRGIGTGPSGPDSESETGGSDSKAAKPSGPVRRRGK